MLRSGQFEVFLPIDFTIIDEKKEMKKADKNSVLKFLPLKHLSKGLYSMTASNSERQRKKTMEKKTTLGKRIRF